MYNLVLCKSVREKMTEICNYLQFEIIFLMNGFQQFFVFSWIPNCLLPDDNVCLTNLLHLTFYYWVGDNRYYPGHLKLALQECHSRFQRNLICFGQFSQLY